MPDFQDHIYLVSDQYKDASNLNARIHLHERFSTNPYGWFHWVLDQLDLPPQTHILEIGCGSGLLWSNNLHRITPGWHIVLSDFSSGMVRGCRLKLASLLNHFAFEISDATAIPFPDETFDAVITNHLLYHLPDRPRALYGIARILKPAGCLYAATNGEKHLLELDAIIEQNIRAGNTGLLPGNRAKDFTLENGAAQLAPWFSQVEVHHYVDSLVVTEAEPLVDYIHSMIPHERKRTDISQDSNLERTIKEHIARQGCIHIQKSSGIFIAKKGGIVNV